MSVSMGGGAVSARSAEVMVSVSTGGGAVGARSAEEAVSASTGGSAECARSAEGVVSVSMHWAAASTMQGLRRKRYLSARAAALQCMQGVWWGQYLSARETARKECEKSSICQHGRRRDIDDCKECRTTAPRTKAPICNKPNAVTEEEESDESEEQESKDGEMSSTALALNYRPRRGRGCLKEPNSEQEDESDGARQQKKQKRPMPHR